MLPHIADLSVAAGVELHSRSRHSRESNKDERQMLFMHGGSQHRRPLTCAQRALAKTTRIVGITAKVTSGTSTSTSMNNEQKI